MGWHDAAFQSKNYDTETYKKVQNNRQYVMTSTL